MDKSGGRLQNKAVPYVEIKCDVQLNQTDHPNATSFRHCFAAASSSHLFWFDVAWYLAFVLVGVFSCIAGLWFFCCCLFCAFKILDEMHGRNRVEPVVVMMV